MKSVSVTCDACGSEAKDARTMLITETGYSVDTCVDCADAFKHVICDRKRWDKLKADYLVEKRKASGK